MQINKNQGGQSNFYDVNFWDTLYFGRHRDRKEGLHRKDLQKPFLRR